MKAFLLEQVDISLEYDKQLLRCLIEKVMLYESRTVVEFKLGLETDVEI